MYQLPTGYAASTVAETLSAAAPMKEAKGFFGSIWDEISQTAKDVAGTGLSTLETFFEERLKADLWGKKQLVDPTPQPGATPAPTGGVFNSESAMPVAVLGGGALLLTAALLFRKG